MKKRVLIVDQDPGTGVVLGELLEGLGAELHTASQDDEGFHRFLEVGPDLLFIEVLLPKKGGLALLRRIREARGGKEVPAFVMGAVHRDTDIRTEAVGGLGALDFLKKPLTAHSLRERLRALLAEDAPASLPGAVTPFSPTEILTRGSLAAVDFPVLLQDLAFHKATGCLNVQWGRAKKVVFLQDGEITFALSNQMRETLGRYLLDRGAVGEAAYREGIDAMLRTKRKLGEFLVARGLIDPESLVEAVRDHVARKVLDIFTWQGGDFRLSPHQEPPARIPGRPLEGHRLLWDGVRSHLPFERVTSTLRPQVALHLLPAAELFGVASEVPLGGEDLHLLRVLRRLRGKKLGDVLGELKGEAEVRFLYYLLLRGYLTLSRGAGERPAWRLDPADMERVRRARHRLEALRSRNYFQVLEVPLTASDEKVRESYLTRAKDVHPDMLAPSDPPELRQIHAEIFHLVQAAYEALKAEVRRREYLKFLQEGLEEEVAGGARVLEAEACFQEGRLLLRRRAWDDAAEALRRAWEANPEEGEYALHLGIARLHQAAAGRENVLPEAEELLLRARGLLGASAEPSFRLGHLRALQGDLEAARTHLEAALARDPNHVQALRELRLLRMRQERKGSVLGALFGRKEKR
ncbi:MAG: response regulator [Deferrisomatales bacterium]|nr:response regulator [Deferrisomatales bacterium]